jgi:hypothetical protein
MTNTKSCDSEFEMDLEQFRSFSSYSPLAATSITPPGLFFSSFLYVFFSFYWRVFSCRPPLAGTPPPPQHLTTTELDKRCVSSPRCVLTPNNNDLRPPPPPQHSTTTRGSRRNAQVRFYYIVFYLDFTNIFLDVNRIYDHYHHPSARRRRGGLVTQHVSSPGVF